MLRWSKPEIALAAVALVGFGVALFLLRGLFALLGRCRACLDRAAVRSVVKLYVGQQQEAGRLTGRSGSTSADPGRLSGGKAEGKW
jgi:hypothetical protein